MIADRQTHTNTHTHRHAHHNTPLPIEGRVTTDDGFGDWSGVRLCFR